MRREVNHEHHYDLPRFDIFETDCTEKEQAKKIVEEANEVLAACIMGNEELMMEECMDTVQAVINLAHKCGWTMGMMVDAYCRVRDRNIKRGYYGD